METGFFYIKNVIKKVGGQWKAEMVTLTENFERRLQVLMLMLLLMLMLMLPVVLIFEMTLMLILLLMLQLKCFKGSTLAGTNKQVFTYSSSIILSNCRATSFANECHRDHRKRI